jgi:hypothetical protein
MIHLPSSNQIDFWYEALGFRLCSVIALLSCMIVVHVHECMHEYLIASHPLGGRAERIN